MVKLNNIPWIIFQFNQINVHRGYKLFFLFLLKTNLNVPTLLFNTYISILIISISRLLSVCPASQKPQPPSYLHSLVSISPISIQQQPSVFSSPIYPISWLHLFSDPSLVSVVLNQKCLNLVRLPVKIKEDDVLMQMN